MLYFYVFRQVNVFVQHIYYKAVQHAIYDVNNKITNYVGNSKQATNITLCQISLSKSSRVIIIKY